MGQILHGSATTTEAVRRAIQNSQESLRALAKRYSINQKTVQKWRGRSSVSDLPTGPKEKKSTVLSREEEAMIVAFRRHTLLLLDDCLYALQATIPHLTRSSLHRCLQRHGVSRLPDTDGGRRQPQLPPKREFVDQPREPSTFLPASNPADSLNHFQPDLGIPLDSFRADNALVCTTQLRYQRSTPYRSLKI